MYNLKFVNRKGYSTMGKIKKHYKDGMLFKVFITTLIVILFIFVSLFLIYLVSILKQTDSPQTYYDMLGVISGFAGAFLGSIITLVAVYATLQSSKKQLKETLKANEKQTEASLNASRQLMLEERRIENLPYFHVYPILDAEQPDDFFKFSIDLSENSNGASVHPCVLLIKNISNAYALNANVRLIDSRDERIIETQKSNVNILYPQSVTTLGLFFKIDDKLMVRRLETEKEITNKYKFTMFYDTINDLNSKLAINSKEFESHGLSSNSYNTDIIIIFTLKSNIIKIEGKSQSRELVIDIESFNN